MYRYLLADEEGDHVADVHTIATGTTTGIKIEGLLLLVQVKDHIKITIKNVRKIS